MPKAKFQLRGVTIEGFKGVTHKQTVSFSRRHAFLFGKNYSGKSSIVEAIRWCLFGLAERPEREVRNTYYAPGECQVDLELEAPDGIWHVQRRLRPGWERSRGTIRNPSGQEVLQSQVFPYLARMGPKEGTHIIFAAQQTSGRRPQADISDFHKVLYSYLHLEEVPDLLKCLDNLLEEQQSAREDVASEINDIEETLRDKLNEADLSLEELLRNPPWGEDTVPTHVESEAKARNFAEEIAKLTNRSVTADASPQEALEQAEQWCQELANASREEMERKLNEQRNKAIALNNLLQNIKQAEKSQAEAQESIGQLEEELASACEGQPLEELEVKLKLFSKQMMESNAKLAIAKEAEEYCKAYSATDCPVCLEKHTADDLIAKIKLSIQQATPEQVALAEELDSLQGRYKRASELNAKLDELTAEVQKAQKEHANTISEIRLLLEVSEDSPFSEDDSKVRLLIIASSVRTLENTLESKESWYTEWRKRIDALRSEFRFHKYRDKQQRLHRQLTTALGPVREDLRRLVELHNAVHTVKEVLREVFNEVIDRALPPLSIMMTDVYLRLTEQPSFERVYIERMDTSSGQSLQVRVGSDRIPGQLFNPEDVLNGQANSALQLVPYFVFSQFTAEALDLDLLLIDDPSQSFDTSHVELLMQELAAAGSHAQLVVATHEEERFRPQLSQYFPTSEYEVIKFMEFNPERGPSFAIER